MSGILVLDIVLLALILITAVATVEVRSLYSAVMLSSIYSLLMACFWVAMDAVDVAYTEAAVGAGISTILLIGTLVLTGSVETVRKAVSWPALAICAAAGGFLIFGTLDMPRYGDRDAPANRHPIYEGYTTQNVPKADGKSAQDVKRFEEEQAAIAQQQAGEHPGEPAAEHAHGAEHTDFFHGHVPNQVTSIIVAYRGYDTMFETAVILTAGMSLILLLRGRRGNPQRGGLL